MEFYIILLWARIGNISASVLYFGNDIQFIARQNDVHYLNQGKGTLQVPIFGNNITVWWKPLENLLQ